MPHVGLVTNMGSAHAGNLGGVDGVAKAKAELFQALDKASVAVVNADDPRCVREANRFAPQHKIFFGHDERADVRIIHAKSCHGQDQGMDLTLRYKESESRIILPLEGQHNASNAAAAVAVAMALNVPFEDAVHGMTKVPQMSGRLHKYTLEGNITVFDDSYNANPESMQAGLKVLMASSGDRRIAILGEMMELGGSSMQAHRAIGSALVGHGVDQLFCCGELAEGYCEGAQANGLSPDSIFWAANSDGLSETVEKEIKEGDVLLVKGSRGAQMERVLERLKGRGKVGKVDHAL